MTAEWQPPTVTLPIPVPQRIEEVFPGGETGLSVFAREQRDESTDLVHLCPTPRLWEILEVDLDSRSWRIVPGGSIEI